MQQQPDDADSGGDSGDDSGGGGEAEVRGYRARVSRRRIPRARVSRSRRVPPVSVRRRPHILGMSLSVLQPAVSSHAVARASGNVRGAWPFRRTWGGRADSPLAYRRWPWLRRRYYGYGYRPPLLGVPGALPVFPPVLPGLPPPPIPAIGGDAPGSPWITLVQGCLQKLLGPGATPSDGVLGRQTRKALRAFQKQNGLPPTGDLDNVDLGLEAMAVLVGLGVVVPGGGADEPAPERRGQQRGPLRDRRQEVAVARWLPAEGEGPARPQDPGELRERLARGRGCDGGRRGRRRGRSSRRRRAASPPRPRPPAPPGPGARAFSSSVASIPGEMSVAVARSIAPAWSRLSEK